MRHLALVILFIFALPSLSLAAKVARPEVVRLGFIPGEGSEELRKNADLLAQSLSKKVGVPFRVVIPDNYSQLIEKMKNKEVDMAFFTAMTYVFAEKTANAKVLVKKVWEEPYHYSSIWSKPGISKIEDLKGKTIAFVDEKSTSGFLYPQVMLKKKGFSKDGVKTLFSGNHRESVQLLASGKVDAIAVFSDDAKGERSAWTKYSPKGAAKPNLLWVSEPIPNDPFCVRQDFYDQYPVLSHEVMFALVEYKDESEEKNLLKKLFGVREVQFATSRQYEPVREMVRELNLKLQ